MIACDVSPVAMFTSVCLFIRFKLFFSSAFSCSYRFSLSFVCSHLFLSVLSVKQCFSVICFIYFFPVFACICLYISDLICFFKICFTCFYLFFYCLFVFSPVFICFYKFVLLCIATYCTSPNICNIIHIFCLYHFISVISSYAWIIHIVGIEITLLR